MSSFIPNFPSDGVVTVNRIVLKPEYDVDDLEERVAMLCENVKTYHSDTGFIGGFVTLNAGMVSNEGSTAGQAIQSHLKDRQALIVTFWKTFEDHEQSHKSDAFQPLFAEVIELCENGNEEIAYSMMWSGKAYTPEEAEAARSAKERFAAQNSLYSSVPDFIIFMDRNDPCPINKPIPNCLLEANSGPI